MISAEWSNQESERRVLHEKEKGSIFADRNGTIAQLVEQRTENPCVPGSIPGGTTSKKRKSRKINDLRDFVLVVLTEVVTILYCEFTNQDKHLIIRLFTQSSLWLRLEFHFHPTYSKSLLEYFLR